MLKGSLLAAEISTYDNSLKREFSTTPQRRRDLITKAIFWIFRDHLVHLSIASWLNGTVARRLR
jgi:hypothetical protein